MKAMQTTGFHRGEAMRVCIGTLAVLCAALVLVAPGRADAGSDTPDYAKAASWVCRPGSDAVCTSGLTTKVVFADGRVEIRPVPPAHDPAIDCFYVYPTISREDRDFADLTDSPEIQEVVKSHAGMLSSRCRVFAPIYRQATLKHLRDELAGERPQDSGSPYQDVLAAWNYYLQHDNRGRGVILIGHSQGTILLQRLMAENIDGKPAQSLLVSAFLAGDPSLGAPSGKSVGGTFQKIPLCNASGQTGCVYAWGSYLEGQSPGIYAFGGRRSDGLESVCANPASPGGGKGLLKSIYPRPSSAPEGDPPFLETVDQLSGGCEVMQGAHVFVVHVPDGRFSQRYMAMLERAVHRPAWGLHPLDISLVEGNILDVVDAELASWKSAHPR